MVARSVVSMMAVELAPSLVLVMVAMWGFYRVASKVVRKVAVLVVHLASPEVEELVVGRKVLVRDNQQKMHQPLR